MKFRILDARVHDDHAYSSNKYQYLDDLLDKTFLTYYFLDRTASSSSEASKSMPLSKHAP